MKSSRLSIIILILVSIFFLCSQKSAANEDRIKTESVSHEEKDNRKTKLLDKMDKAHEKISDYLLTSAVWLDSFFDDERYEAEDNHSRLKVKFSSFFEDGEDIDFKARLNLRLVLNQLSEKFHLVISGNPDDDLDSDYISGANIKKEFTDENDEQEDKNLVFALQYFLQSTRRNNLKMEGGVRWGDRSPVLWAGPRFRWLFDNTPWTYRFTQRVRWFTDDGWYINSSFDCERPLSSRFFFRTTAAGTWEQEVDGYNYNVFCNIYQTLSSNRALEYQLENAYRTRPAYELTDVIVSLMYRQKIWRDWITFEVKPQVAFPRDNDFDFTPGIKFTIEGRFGWNP